AEDGIRDLIVTGVQTCALPIYTNTLRRRGLTRDASIQAAGPVRLRPILMTTCATVIGMLPVALQIGRASEMRSPMAIVVIGGLKIGRASCRERAEIGGETVGVR